MLFTISARPCARLRAQAVTGPPHTMQRRSAPRESFSPSVPITSMSNNRASASASSMATALRFISPASAPNTKNASQPVFSRQTSRNNAGGIAAAMRCMPSRNASSMSGVRFTSPAMFMVKQTTAARIAPSTPAAFPARRSRAESISSNVIFDIFIRCVRDELPDARKVALLHQRAHLACGNAVLAFNFDQLNAASRQKLLHAFVVGARHRAEPARCRQSAA